MFAGHPYIESATALSILCCDVHVGGILVSDVQYYIIILMIHIITSPGIVSSIISVLVAIDDGDVVIGIICSTVTILECVHDKRCIMYMYTCSCNV